MTPASAVPASVWSRRARWTMPSVSLAALICLGLGIWTDLREPTSADWQIVGVMAAVAVMAMLVDWRVGPPDDESTPPWSVHTLWLLPAALLTPPFAFLPLLALSVLLSLARRAHGLPTRLAVASTTVITTVEIHWMAQAFDDLLLAGVIGIGAQYVTGLVVALTAAFVFTGPTGTALWLDYRWSFVQLGCGFAGVLTAAAIGSTPLAGLLALAPVLMAEFTLHWPELDRQARIDGKTGLPNARHWDDRSRDLISAAELHGTPVTVAIIDIDHFKAVNDTYGHLVGDEVLEGCAGTLRSQINPGDLVGRFGGEEFVVTLFGLPGDKAVEVAERIRLAIGAQLHQTRPRQVTESSDHDASGQAGTFAITCTIGVATSDVFGFDLLAMLRAADEALAEGKRAGRDRVHTAPGRPSRTHADRARRGGLGGDVVSALRAASTKRSWTDVANQQRSTRRRDQDPHS